ncbi:MAG: SAM-dependent DNA methyltransferase [Planctomycetes bacterium]|nr:SAM-dependent DNA methyltransferase [Planctomycetota bacterium]
MAKDSKLHEKAVRMSDMAESKKELAITAYLQQVQTLPGEAARSHRFTVLLDALFGTQPGFIEEYVKGIEQYLKVPGKDRILRGRADQLSGNLIIEFENDLSKKDRAAEAKEQLRRYTACLWSHEHPEHRTRFVCLATDARRFRAFAPVAQRPDSPACEPADVRLTLLEELDAGKPDVPWTDLYFFLDRYLLRKEILPPTSEHVVKDFGPRSHAFQVAEAALLREWARRKQNPEYAVRYETWEKYLRIVYGSAVADDALFIRHTYLATVAKLMVWRRAAPTEEAPDGPTIQTILDGTYFRVRMGVENFLEEDFFCWLARAEAAATGLAVARDIISLLANYNLRELSEDVLKALYEGLVDPATRHDLGEYYTPDWLAHRIVRKTLEPNPEASVLDPACGSGTFLYMTIREKRRLLAHMKPTALIQHIVGSVVGMDIHPLAVIVAKANYVLGLGELVAQRKRRVSIPVYMANSIRPPQHEVRRELWHQVDCYRAEMADRVVHIPKELIEDPHKCDHAIEAAHSFALSPAGGQVNEDTFAKHLETRHPGLCDKTSSLMLFSVAQSLHALIREKRDTIWVFVLKNIYRPLFMSRRFDLLLGNPPWLSYRYVERSEYQEFLKTQITRGYGLLREKAHLVTQLELGSLFMLRCADLYLKEGGGLAFVLPKSIFSADQHDALRRRCFKKPKPFTVTDLWDLEGVAPLFKTSAAVLFATRSGGAPPDAPIPGEVLSGDVPSRNATLPAVQDALATQQVIIRLSTMGERSFWSTGPSRRTAGSPYRELFDNGANIYPRCFWFADFRRHEEFGGDESLPFLTSSERAREEAKAAYQGCVIQGPVESRFIYATMLPVDMVPFGHVRLRLVVLPALVRQGAFALFDDEAHARRQFHYELADWLKRVEAEWAQRRGPKIKASSVQWLDYRKKLSSQRAHAPVRLLYAKSGTHLCACVFMQSSTTLKLECGLKARGFAVDHTTYHMEPESANEAHYLAAILNARSVDDAIKDAQARGLWGARDIHTKVLDLPIPRFDPQRKAHARLAELGAECAERVAAWIRSGGPGQVRSTGLLRRRVREMLRDELAEIDSIVKPMLGL